MICCTMGRVELNDKKRWAEIMEGQGEINFCISRALSESWSIGTSNVAWA